MLTDKQIEIGELNLRSLIDVPEIDIERIREDPAHMELEKCCGNCCWFYGETTDGDGFCAEAKDSSWKDFTRCDRKCWLARGGCDNPCFVSRQEMRHHMAVLLQFVRWATQKTFPLKYKPVDVPEVAKAAEFAYRYMKVFSKL